MLILINIYWKPSKNHGVSCFFPGDHRESGPPWILLHLGFIWIWEAWPGAAWNTVIFVWLEKRGANQRTWQWHLEELTSSTWEERTRPSWWSASVNRTSSSLDTHIFHHIYIYINICNIGYIYIYKYTIYIYNMFLLMFIYMIDILYRICIHAYIYIHMYIYIYALLIYMYICSVMCLIHFRVLPWTSAP